MKSNVMKLLLAGSAMAVTMATTAQAQFTSPPAQDVSVLLGDNTAGTESGIFEFLPLVATGAGVAIAIAVGIKGWQVAANLIRKVRT